jgi:hypothetical protein
VLALRTGRTCVEALEAQAPVAAAVRWLEAERHRHQQAAGHTRQGRGSHLRQPCLRSCLAGVSC